MKPTINHNCYSFAIGLILDCYYCYRLPWLGGGRGGGWGERGPGARPDLAWFPPVSPRLGGAGVVGGVGVGPQ